MSQRATLASACGLLLAGGRSQRFGAEKAVAQFRDRTLIDVVADRFAGCAALAVSARRGCAAEQHALAHDWTVLHDDGGHPTGPLAGVCAGLRWARARGAVLLAVAPCDTPLLPVDLFSALLGDLGEAPAAYAITAEGEHPLCAIWRVALLRPLESELAAKKHPPVHGFLRAQGAQCVTFKDASHFVNANTLEDLNALENAT